MENNKFSKYLFGTVLLLLTGYSSAEVNTNKLSLDSYDFEEIKYRFFSSNRIDTHQTISPDDSQCLNELQAIGNGLRNSELWAHQLANTWGKLPSGIMYGNTYDFGAFSNCFHIEKNNELYQTKYCVQQMELGMEGVSNTFDIFYPNLLKYDNDTLNVVRKHVLLQVDPFISVGICVPAKCSADFIRNTLNSLQSNDRTNFIKFIGSKCQLEEKASELKTLDWIAIGVLSTVLFLIVISTSYDIVCTVLIREKSEALLAFSFFTNGKKLLSCKYNESPDVMSCFHGIRSITTQWVVCGHVFWEYLQRPNINRAVIPNVLRMFMRNLFFSYWASLNSSVMLALLMTLETFLTISGLLVAIGILKELERTKGKLNVMRLYMRRYIRLTPLLGVVILFSMTLMRFFGDGPLWTNIDKQAQRCENHWWSSLLYIQNYYNHLNLCVIPTWSLSVDMHLFILAPFIIYFMYRYETKAILGIVLLIGGCMAGTVATYVNADITFILQNIKYGSYYRTHFRCTSWFIGVILGYIMYKSGKKQINIPRVYNLLGWTLSLAALIAVGHSRWQFDQVDFENTSFEFGLCDAFGRVLWSIAVGYIIFACVNNSGGVVNWFLSHPLWQPFSRISYSTFLLHYPVIFILMDSMKTPLNFSEFNMWTMYFAAFILTTFVSIIATLAFESPIPIIEKFVFATKKKPMAAHKND